MRVILAALFLWLLLSSSCAFAQSPNGSIRGIVLDPDAQSIPGAEVIVVNDATGVKYVRATNGEGIYAVENLPPGPYRIQVSKFGFKGIIKPDLILNVQDALSLNFTLPIGASSVVVTVEGGAPLINTTEAAVSTVVDRQFAENLPMNGRSFQTLIQLTPGVVFTPTNTLDNGQFSVNGQRASSNYWMVDGVGANIGITSGASSYLGNGLGGAVGSFSALGGTNSLVSVDAMQEFRIQTSTFAPEFGSTPGGQISIVTRSGTDQFHGTAFNYLRNGAIDANNWFADANKLAKPAEKQNDFGGVLSGPIKKDRTFFFFSYEGLRLRLPQTTLTTVPDLSARQNASPTMQPYLNAFPLPNGPEVAANPGAAQFNASFANPGSLDAYSLRIDHSFSNRLSVFGRYNYSPSETSQRGGGGVDALSVIRNDRITTQTGTIGATWALSPAVTNDLRFNLSRVNASSSFALDGFRGAAPLTTLPLPKPYTLENSQFTFNVFSLKEGNLYEGTNGRNIQRQFNVVDGLSLQKGSHSLKMGVDFRRLSPVRRPFLYEPAASFSDVASAETGNLEIGDIYSSRNFTLLFHDLGVFAQDTWRATPRLSLTYGVRWDVDFASSSGAGPSLPSVRGYDLRNLSNLTLAPSGTAPFQTTYGNFAPRIGMAYQISANANWQTVVRGGFGVFYDLVDSEVGNTLIFDAYPFGSVHFLLGKGLGGTATFPFSPAESAPGPISPSFVWAFDPNLKLPYALEWNVAVEQSLGVQQTISASYIGSVGRRLLQTATISSPNPNFSQAQLVGNSASSTYGALQVQYQRRLSRGLQSLASYSWSHSIDDASAGSVGNHANLAVPSVNPNVERGPSDFDIRNAFSAGVTYDVPAPKINRFAKQIVQNWSAETFVVARSAPPVDVSEAFFYKLNSGIQADVRPDLLPGVPVYLYGSVYPGGKAFNPAAFTNPPVDPVTRSPLRQGNAPRNFLRGFGATQWDLAIHRTFPVRESIKVQFRAEIFNVLNHPNFGSPYPYFGVAGFGISNQTLGQALAGGGAGTGGLNSLYQLGGPRSIQFALKLMF